MIDGFESIFLTVSQIETGDMTDWTGRPADVEVTACDNGGAWRNRVTFTVPRNLAPRIGDRAIVQYKFMEQE